MTELKSLLSFSLSPNQGTTVRVITAVDQDKGRPRGIGYTIVSGKQKSTPFDEGYPKRATAGGLCEMAFETCLQGQSLLRKETNGYKREGTGLRGHGVWGPWEQECVSKV